MGPEKMNELRVLKRFDRPSYIAVRCGNDAEYVRAYPVVDIPASTLNALLVRILVGDEEKEVWLPKSQAVWRGNAQYHDIYISPWIAEKKGL